VFSFIKGSIDHRLVIIAFYLYIPNTWIRKTKQLQYDTCRRNHVFDEAVDKESINGKAR
jgi:hypothetical protein